MRPYGKFTKHILLGIGIAGIVVVTATAPGVVLAAKLFDINKRQSPKRYEKRKATQTIRRLQRNNLITVKKKHGQFVCELTKEGKRVFKEIQQNESQLNKLKITKPARWDGKWRIFIFDIPDNTHRRARDILRGRLKKWEFVLLQKSVWVCPWPCEKELRAVAELYKVSRYIKIIVAQEISDDTLLKKYFGL